MSTMISTWVGSVLTRSAAVAGALLLGLGVASCSGDGDDAASADTSTTGPVTSATSASARTTTPTPPVQGGGGGTGGGDIAVGEPTPGGGGSGGGDGGGGGGGPVDDRCSVGSLSRAFGDGPGDIVGVAYCDGDWAVSQGSDDSHNRVFMHREHGWAGFAADSVRPDDGTSCYTAERLQTIGAPAGVRALLPWCDRGQPPETPAACSIDSLHRTPGTEDIDTLVYCDEQWMRAGQSQTDNVRSYVVSGYLWQEFPPDGTTQTGYPCYTKDRLDRANVSGGMRDLLTVCPDTPVPQAQ